MKKYLTNSKLKKTLIACINSNTECKVNYIGRGRVCFHYRQKHCIIDYYAFPSMQFHSIHFKYDSKDEYYKVSHDEMNSEPFSNIFNNFLLEIS